MTIRLSTVSLLALLAACDSAPSTVSPAPFATSVAGVPTGPIDATLSLQQTTPATPGQLVTFEVGNAQPGQQVGLLLSTQGTGPGTLCPPQLNGHCFELLGNLQRAFSVADANGDATFTLPVPATATAGDTFWLQAGAAVSPGVNPNLSNVHVLDAFDLDGDGIVVPQPFECDGEFIVVLGSSTSAGMNAIDTSTSPASLFPLGQMQSFPYNALGFRTEDDYFYGVDPRSLDFVRVGALGGVQSLGQPDDLSLLATEPVFAGDILPDGTFAVGGTVVATYDVTTTPPSLLTPAVALAYTDGSPGAPQFYDWATDPVTGMLWGFDHGTERFAMVDPATGATTPVGAVAAWNYGGGTAFFDENGRLFIYGIGTAGSTDQDTLFQVDIVTGGVTELLQGPVVTHSDGAFCARDTGTDGELTVAPVTNPGDCIAVSLTDSDLDSGAVIVDSVSVLLTNTSTGEEEPVTLVETASDSGVFAACVPTSECDPAEEADATGVLHLMDGDGYEVAYEDLLTSTGLSNSAVAEGNGLGTDPTCMPMSEPFECDGQYVIVLGSTDDAQLLEVNTNASPLELDPLGAMESYNYNAIGFRPADSTLYGIRIDTLEFVTVGGNGVVTNLGLPDDLSLLANTPVYAGDIDLDGSYVVGGTAIATYDVTTSPPMLLGDAYDLVYTDGTAGTPQFFDWAVSPVDGTLWGYDFSSARFARIDPATGEVSPIGTPSPWNYGGGSAFFDDNGRLFIYGVGIPDGTAQDTLFQVNIATGIVTPLLSGPEVSNTDGAFCARTEGEDALLSFDNQVAPGECITISLTDADLNTGAALSETVEVTVVNTTTGELETLTLTETDPDSGTFTACAETSSCPDEAADDTQKLYVEEGHIYEIYYNDLLTTVGTAADVTGTGDVFGDRADTGCLDPFTCDGRFLIILGSPTTAQLSYLDQDVSPLEFDPVGANEAYNYNAIGYRESDGVLYGIRLDTQEFVMVGGNGAVQNLGLPDDLDLLGNNPIFAGDMLLDGSYAVGGNVLVTYNVASTPPSKLAPGVPLTYADGSTGTPTFIDWATDPMTGDLWGFDYVSRHFASIDVATGEVTKQGLMAPYNLGGGSAFFDDLGNFYIYGISVPGSGNQDTLYAVDRATGGTTALGSAGVARNTDGTFCRTP